MINVGNAESISLAVVIFISSIWEAVKTSTTIGISWAFASVFVAETITSSIPPESWEIRLKGAKRTPKNITVLKKFFIL